MIRTTIKYQLSFENLAGRTCLTSSQRASMEAAGLFDMLELRIYCCIMDENEAV